MQFDVVLEKGMDVDQCQFNLCCFKLTFSKHQKFFDLIRLKHSVSLIREISLNINVYF